MTSQELCGIVALPNSIHGENLGLNSLKFCSTIKQGELIHEFKTFSIPYTHVELGILVWRLCFNIKDSKIELYMHVWVLKKVFSENYHASNKEVNYHNMKIIDLMNFL